MSYSPAIPSLLDGVGFNHWCGRTVRAGIFTHLLLWAHICLGPHLSGPTSPCLGTPFRIANVQILSSTCTLRLAATRCCCAAMEEPWPSAGITCIHPGELFYGNTQQLSCCDSSACVWLTSHIRRTRPELQCEAMHRFVVVGQGMYARKKMRITCFGL